jgi:von Hippel-Lindau disease tumor supressor
MRALWTAIAPIAAILMTSSAVYAAPTKCLAEAKLRSVAGTTTTTIAFRNTKQNVLKLYWLNYKGRREFWADIAPEGNLPISTYVAHPWVITDEQGNCISVYVAGGTESHTVTEGD